MHVFDLIGIHVGRGRFNRCRQVIDNFALRCWLPDFSDSVTNLECKVRLRGAEHLWRVFVKPFCLGILCHVVHDALRAFGRDLFDFVAIHVEHDAAKAWRARVVQVNHCALGARCGFNGARDQLWPCLCQRDNGDVIRNQLVINKLADKVKVGL